MLRSHFLEATQTIQETHYVQVALVSRYLLPLEHFHFPLLNCMEKVDSTSEDMKVTMLHLQKTREGEVRHSISFEIVSLPRLLHTFQADYHFLLEHRSYLYEHEETIEEFEAQLHCLIQHPVRQWVDEARGKFVNEDSFHYKQCRVIHVEMGCS